MGLFKKSFVLMSLVLSSLASQPACAEASAIAFGSEGSWGWATRKDQKEANNAAISFCNRNNVKTDCALDVTKAVVRAEGLNRTGYGRSTISLADARKQAVEACGIACKVTFETTKPGFYSLAKAEVDKEGNVHFHLAYQGDDSDKVDELAKQRCETQAGRQCTLVWSGAIPGAFKINSPLRPFTVASERSCRPNTPTIRCTSKCVNGDCIVTYENNCQIRVQVQPQFDPFQNQWIYPSPSC